MSFKRIKSDKDEQVNNSTDPDQRISLSDINELIRADVVSVPQLSYHDSVCGSILRPPISNSSEEIFSYLRIGNLDAFRRSLEVHHAEIANMRNHALQTVLHTLVNYSYPFVWIRLLMMRGSDLCAQDIDGYTPAHYAIMRDDVEMLKALTTRFHAHIKPVTEEHVQHVQEQCLKALTIRNHQGLTSFMLACQRESMKCLNYLIELKINDSNLMDRYGETCLHYSVCRRNLTLTEKLIKECNADVNGGDQSRPSVLDVIQFVRRQQNSSEQSKVDEIEQLLLSNMAYNRRKIHQQTAKRKASEERDDLMANNIATLTLDLTTSGSIETSRNYARIAMSLQKQGDSMGALKNFQIAMSHVNQTSLDWANYAYRAALILQEHDKQKEALDLLSRALKIHLDENESDDEVKKLKMAISSIEKNTNS